MLAMLKRHQKEHSLDRRQLSVETVAQEV
jgi:hypothetical protein